ncbi:MAG TPA: hypothetical protein PLD88_11275, partial [Candidatus Berkiella sp.]|nr:hypothetical protein [Candidatus Berkiella sp.]
YTENNQAAVEVREPVAEIIQDGPFYELPTEIQLNILEQLISEPDFFKHLSNFAQVARWSNVLTKDFNLWIKIAQHWFSLESPRRKDKYDFFSKALEGIVSVDNSLTLGLALKNLEEFGFPHYIGSALHRACKAGNLSLARLLLTNLLTKNQHTRDHLIQSACKTALENKYWPIVALLAQTDDCRKNTQLIREISTEAAANNQADLVEQMLEQDLEKLSLTDKLSIVGTPGFAATGLDLNDLFVNNHWLVRTLLCFGLRQLGYQVAPELIIEEVVDDVDIDKVADLLENFTLEDETPTFIVSNMTNATAESKEQLEALVEEEPKAKTTVTHTL